MVNPLIRYCGCIHDEKTSQRSSFQYLSFLLVLINIESVCVKFLPLKINFFYLENVEYMRKRIEKPHLFFCWPSQFLASEGFRTMFLNSQKNNFSSSFFFSFENISDNPQDILQRSPHKCFLISVATRSTINAYQ